MSGAAPSSGLTNLVDKLDKSLTLQQGENGFTEYSKSQNDLRERLVQLTFQSVRSGLANRYSMSRDFAQWVYDVLSSLKSASSEVDANNASELLELGFRSVLHLRDVMEGKGECRLAYSMLIGWHTGCQRFAVAFTLPGEISSFATLSTRLLARLFMSPCPTQQLDHQYGSFKDFKYLCQEFVLHKMCAEGNPNQLERDYETSKRLRNGKWRRGEKTFRFSEADLQWLKNHPVVSYMAVLFASQIQRDFQQLEDSSVTQKTISLAARWAPRHGSELFGPLAHLLEHTVVPESAMWLSTSRVSNKRNVRQLIQKKVATTYRKRLSALNRYLETVQVKQCEHNWKDIDFDKHVTSITLAKQKSAFRKETDEDRKQCAENFRAFQERVKAGSSTAKGKHVQIKDFVKEALRLGSNGDEDYDPSLLDAMWENKGENINGLGNFIAMVDTSGSMESYGAYPLYTAMGLGIRIAEKSLIGRRVMTFSNTPTWFNLPSQSFTHNVNQLRGADWGMNTNFSAALTMILKAAEEANLTADDVNALTLVVLSDMQMDHAGSYDDVLYEHIKRQFADTGLRVSGTAWNVPRIVFWNLRKTSGFPSKSDDERSVMISGGSDALLNDLCEEGLASLEKLNPWNQLCQMLKKSRYDSNEFKEMSSHIRSF